jgi:archaeal flagellar protein FlaI
VTCLTSYIDELKSQMENSKKDKDVKKTSKKEEQKEISLEDLSKMNTKNKEVNDLKQDSDIKNLNKLDSFGDFFSKKVDENLKDSLTSEIPKEEQKEDKDTKKEDDLREDAQQKLEKEIPSKDPSFTKQFKESLKKTKEEISLDQNQQKEDFEKNWDEKSHLVTKYGDVEIFRIDDQLLLHYKIPTPKPSPSQKLIINTLKEAATRLITTDPYKIRDPIQRRNIYYQKILDILENAPEINIPKHLFHFYADAVVKEMVGYGLIEPLLQDDKLEEIMIVGPKKPTYVYHIDYGMMTTNVIFYSDEGIYEIIDKIARTLGRRVDISSPLLDARLPDGSRVNATIPPASIDGSTLTIRKFKADPYTIVDLINFGTLNLEVGSFLWAVVDGFGGAKPANIVISGGTSSGKTTTLNVLANFISESERILTIEDTAELKLPIKHIVRFEGKPPGLEGKGELTLDILVKNTLRMRPDRIIVGEIRHTEALSLFTAMNTGHDGCMGTIHANSAKETLVRITSPPMSVPMLMLAGLDFVIVQKKISTQKGMRRRITAIAEITGVLENKPQANIIFKWNPQSDSLERTELPIEFFEKIKQLTKFSDADIRKILEKRINLLNTMVNNNIRDIEEVSHVVQNFYVEEKRKR